MLNIKDLSTYLLSAPDSGPVVLNMAYKVALSGVVTPLAGDERNQVVDLINKHVPAKDIAAEWGLSPPGVRALRRDPAAWVMVKHDQEIALGALLQRLAGEPSTGGSSYHACPGLRTLLQNLVKALDNGGAVINRQPGRTKFSVGDWSADAYAARLDAQVKAGVVASYEQNPAPLEFEQDGTEHFWQTEFFVETSEGNYWVKMCLRSDMPRIIGRQEACAARFMDVRAVDTAWMVANAKDVLAQPPCQVANS